MAKGALELIDWPTFSGALTLLVLTTLPLAIFPELGTVWLLAAKEFVTETLGVFYLALGLGAMLFMGYIAFGEIGQIKLGQQRERPEFSTLSWASMLLSAGIGASILYWSMVEWIYYYQQPPFHIEASTPEAARWAVAYGMFHWGPLAWAIYLIPALPIAYFYYVRGQKALKFSVALTPVLGERHAHGGIGKLVDIAFVFGMLGGAATRLGFAAPLIAQGAHELLGIPTGFKTQVIVLVICASILGYSAFAGLKRGIGGLSKLSLWLSLSLLFFVLVAGPTLFMLNSGLDALGRVLQHFFQMATWTESFSAFKQFPQTGFPQSWTIFYWAWWLVFAPSVGLFIARISRGRTIKSVVLGSIFFGTLGCLLFFMVLGNYGVYLQFSGKLDVVQVLNQQGASSAIFAILTTLPASKLVILVYTAIALIFTAITFDSISHILAAVVQKEVVGEPLRWNRVFWAAALGVMPVTLMFLGGLEALQAASILAGVPLLAVAVLMCISLVKIARADLREFGLQDDKEICLNRLPGDGSWEEKET
ncbi:BCCT family transporter [Microbulbifer sp. ANSA003]|uniref:BCCT family transporter n=1 Tax=Microbulbifer sp. ANSA003 TaxID=3243360 RepID=UPI0040419336